MGRPHSISYEPLFAKVGLGQFCGGLVDARALNNNQLRGLRDTSGFQHVPCIRDGYCLVSGGVELHWPKSCISYGVQRDGSEADEIDFDTAFLGTGDMRGAG